MRREPEPLNDIGRVATPGGYRAAGGRSPEAYLTGHHLLSQLKTLDKKIDFKFSYFFIDSEA